MLRFLANVVLGGILALALQHYVFSGPDEKEEKQRKKKERVSPPSPERYPAWATQLRTDASLKKIYLREWEDQTWREAHGWVGKDLCHNQTGQAVRVLEYYYNSQTAELTGIVWFGPDCESHRGLCHGGAYTSLFDDFCGHIAFIAGSGPWHGATVQVNVSLKKPITIGQVLRVHGSVVVSDRTTKKAVKATVRATLDDGEGTDLYALLEGISVMGIRLPPPVPAHAADDVETREWKVTAKEMRA